MTSVSILKMSGKFTDAVRMVSNKNWIYIFKSFLHLYILGKQLLGNLLDFHIWVVEQY